jgi:hypothetical protein
MPFDVTGIASFNVVRLSFEQDTQCMAVSGLGEFNLYAHSFESFASLKCHRHSCFPILSLAVFASFKKDKLFALE